MNCVGGCIGGGGQPKINMHIKDEIKQKTFPPSSLLKMKPFRIPRNHLFCFHRGSTFIKQATNSQNINSLEQKTHRNLLKRLSCP